MGLLGWFILTGYGLRFLRNVRNGEIHPLPEWGQNTEDLGRGFRLFVAILVWDLPAIALGLLQGFNVGQQGLVAVLGFIYGIIMVLVTPGIYIMMAKDDSKISDGLQFEKIIGWTMSNLGQVFKVVVVTIFAGIVFILAASLLGAVALGIGLLFTVPLAIFVSQLYNSHLYGQLARELD